MWWNFVGRSHEEIVEAREAWEAASARFGEVVGPRRRAHPRAADARRAAHPAAPASSVLDCAQLTPRRKAPGPKPGRPPPISCSGNVDPRGPSAPASRRTARHRGSGCPSSRPVHDSVVRRRERPASPSAGSGVAVSEPVAARRRRCASVAVPRERLRERYTFASTRYVPAVGARSCHLLVRRPATPTATARSSAGRSARPRGRRTGRGPTRRRPTSRARSARAPCPPARRPTTWPSPSPELVAGGLPSPGSTSTFILARPASVQRELTGDAGRDRSRRRCPRRPCPRPRPEHPPSRGRPRSASAPRWRRRSR